MSPGPVMLTRRTLPRGAGIGAVAALGGAVTACTAGSEPAAERGASSSAPATTLDEATQAAPTQPAPNRAAAAGGVLLAYFSHAGENYHYGGRRQLEIGNTEVLAGIVGRLLGCDLYRIEAAEPCPQAYDPTVARNVREQDQDARPELAGELPRLDGYDTVLLASPIWNVRTRMIMWTFTDGLDFAGKTIHPLVTHAVSGLGNAARDYSRSCPGATTGDDLAVQGEEVAAAEPQVQAWLRRVALLNG